MKNLPSAYISEQHWRIAKRKKQVVNYCAMLCFMLGLPALAFAAPEGGEITSGTGAINQVGDLTTINQNTQRLDINWRDFSTQTHETVNFLQPNTSAVAINRVIGGVPSQLRGALNANGRVFLLNNAGITFYGTSQVNVGALIASTAKDVQIDGDQYHFIDVNNASVINQGNISVSQGGFAVLAAPYVKNEGVIQANLGKIELASAPAFTLDLRGDNLITYAIAPATAAKYGVDNTGVLRAKSGTVNITTTAASDIVANTVNLGGVVDVDAFDTHNAGNVTIKSAGDINNTATITANAGAHGNGGRVITLADNTNHFTRQASVSAKGGSESGDGGFVEVSGKHFTFGGKVDTSAAHGKLGTLLIDPDDILIKNGAGTNEDDGLLLDTYYEQNLENQATDINLMATNRITLEDLTDDGLLDLSFADKNITLTANFIQFLNPANTIATTATITMNGGSGGIHVGNLYVSSEDNPGDILLTTTGNGDITTGNLTVTGLNDGIIRVNADGAATINGNVNVDIFGRSVEGIADADITADLIANRDLTLNGDLVLSARTSDNGTVTINALMQGFNILHNGNISSLATNEVFSEQASNITNIINATAVNNYTHFGDSLMISEARAGGEGEFFSGSTLIDTALNIESGNNTLICGDTTIASYGESAGGGVGSTLSINAGNDAGIRGDTHVIAQHNIFFSSEFEPNFEDFFGLDAAANIDITAGANESGNGNIIIGGDLISIATTEGDKIESSEDVETYLAAFDDEEDENEPPQGGGSALSEISLSAPGNIDFYTDRQPISAANNAYYQGITSGSDVRINSEVFFINNASITINSRVVTLNPEEDCPLCTGEEEQPTPPDRRDELPFIPYEPMTPIDFIPTTLDTLAPAGGDDFCAVVNTEDPRVDIIMQPLCRDEIINTGEKLTEPTRINFQYK